VRDPDWRLCLFFFYFRSIALLIFGRENVKKEKKRTRRFEIETKTGAAFGTRPKNKKKETVQRSKVVVAAVVVVVVVVVVVAALSLEPDAPISGHVATSSFCFFFLTLPGFYLPGFAVVVAL